MGKVGGWGDEGEWHGYENLLCCEHHPMSGVLLGSTELISQQSFTLHFDECFSFSIGTKYFGTVACLYTVSKLVLFIHSLYSHKRNQKYAVYTLGRSFQADMQISSRTTKIGWNGQNILQIGNFSKTEYRGVGILFCLLIKRFSAVITRYKT